MLDPTTAASNFIDAFNNFRVARNVLAARQKEESDPDLTLNEQDVDRYARELVKAVRDMHGVWVGEF